MGAYRIREEKTSTGKVIYVIFQFNLAVTSWIRRTIPEHQRKYIPSTKEWRIDESWKTRFISILNQHFDTDSKEDPGSEKKDKYRNAYDKKQKEGEEKDEVFTFTSDKHYATLYLLSTAPDALIKAAYRTLSLIYHPDKNKDDDTLRKMQEINEAHDKIKKSRGI